MEIRATHPGDRDSDEAIAQVGLPSRLRYNFFVKKATDAYNRTGTDAGTFWATLALAEATIIGNER